MTTAKLPVHVVLVNDHGVNVDLAPIAQALQMQANRDVAPAWGIIAPIVSVAPSLNKLPFGAWPIVFKHGLDEPGALGYHSRLHGEPISYVDATDPKGVSVTASHEFVEMCVDPSGNRKWVAPAPDGSGRVQILIEASDGCEEQTYDCEGVQVSDFLYPSFFHGAAHAPFDKLGAISAPRKILKGGYISWVAADGHWHQQTFWGSSPETKVLGRMADLRAEGETTCRETIDRVAREAKAARG